MNSFIHCPPKTSLPVCDQNCQFFSTLSLSGQCFFRGSNFGYSPRFSSEFMTYSCRITLSLSNNCLSNITSNEFIIRDIIAMDLWVKLDKFWRKKRRFYLFSKVILSVSKVRHLPHLPPLRYGHERDLIR